MVVRLWPGPGPIAVRWRGVDLMWGLLAAAPPLALLLWMATAGRRLAFVRRIQRLLEEVLGSTLASLSIPQMALLSTCAGVGEEVLFRGALQPRLGLVLTAVLFGIAHPFTPAYVVLVTLFGLYLGWLVEASGGLGAAIAAHAVYDLVALWVLRRRLRRPA